MSGTDAAKNTLTGMNRQRLRLRRLTLDAVLLAVALVLAIVERWIPLELLVTVPGLKLGLANIVTLFALLRLRPLDALAILVIRCLVMGAITGPMMLLFSLGGGLLALLVMWIISRWEGKVFSVIGISLAGATAHNIGQVAMAGLVLNEPLLLLIYLPPLLLTGLATGLLTGMAAYPVIRLLPPLPKAGKLTAPPAMSTLIILLCLALPAMSLTGCQTKAYQKYSYEFTGTFDTVVQFVGYSKSQAEFDRLSALGEARFRELNALFDPYHDYEGVSNLKTINDQAGQAPVEVAPELLQLIRDAVEWHQTISGKTNIALGAAIVLWQDYRERALADPAQAAVPSGSELTAALASADTEKIQIDLAAGTVFLADPATRLDLGAVGKGYAAELVAQELIAAGAESMIINAGGSNVRLIGKPMDERATWQVGLQNPAALLADDPAAADTVDAADLRQLAAVLDVTDTSVVTSGDYQRYYICGGVVYHHLIDPADGLPAHYFRAVTVVTPDSELADFLSTALFLLPYEQGRELAESLTGVDVLWIFAGGRLEMTDGLKAMVETAQ